MYRTILKKDLKRKKTMNLIVLLFMTLATLFVASSMNNILAVFGGLDGYFTRAGIADYQIVSISDHIEEDKATLDQNTYIESYGTDRVLMVSEKNLRFNGERNEDFSNACTLTSFDESYLKFYKTDNKELTEVTPGTVWIVVKAMEQFGLQPGDTLTVQIGEVKKEFEIAGAIKDALLGGPLTNNPRLLINEADFAPLAEDEEAQNCAIYYIKTNDINKMVSALGDVPITFAAKRSLLQLIYMMDMIIAALLLIVSVLLIATAFIVLRFTIGFTISEEFREIGVMKAIGIRNFRIRLLYLTKYFALAVIGAVLGLGASIPFSSAMLRFSTRNIVLESSNGFLASILSALFVVLIVVLFSYSCTSKIAKLTPLDAIRSGQTGERYTTKGFLRLGKSRLNAPCFLACNDILSAPKRYGLIAFILVLCLMPVMIVANTSNTLCSDRLVTLFGATERDLHFAYNDTFAFFLNPDGEESYLAYTEDVEKRLADAGYPATVFGEMLYQTTVSYGEESVATVLFKGFGTTADEYVYDEGSAPQNKNEIAVTPQVREKLGVEIGDTITLNLTDGDVRCMIVGITNSMSNLGDGIRVHEDLPVSFAQCSGYNTLQLDFEDEPTKEEIAERLPEIRRILDKEEVETPAEFVDSCIGMAETFNMVKYLTLLLAFIVTALVAVLMERSFIEKERGEIAVMKAIGFKSSAIVWQHTLRMSLTALAAAVVSAVISIPLTKLCITPVFGMMGGGPSVNYDYNFLEIFLIFPVLLFAVMTIVTACMAQYTRSIKTSEVSGIE